MAPRDKKGILFISRTVVQSYLSALCVHSRLANVLLRFNLDNTFQRRGGTENYVREQTLEKQSRQLPESALSSCSQQKNIKSFILNFLLLNKMNYMLLFKLFVSRECMLLGSLSRHNKNMEWRTLKPLGRSRLSEDRLCYSSQVSNRPFYTS